MRKIGINMLCFREAKIIQSAIKQWLPFKFHKFVIACSEKPWRGNLKKDNSAELAREMGVEVWEKHWKEEHEQRNEIMEYMVDCDWAFHLDERLGYGGDQYPQVPGVVLYHLQWAKTASQIKDKITSYHHAPEIIPDWFENVWSNPNVKENLHPLSPSVFEGLYEKPIPQEIIDNLDPEWVKEVNG